MKQGKLKKIALAVILVAIVFGIIIFAVHQNFDDTDIKSTDKATDKVSASKKDNSNKNSKKKSIYLQDTEKPDRILAIHPHGTDGIYQYRKSSDGSLYPEQKFFQGDVSLKGDSISVKPDDKQSSAKGFNFKKQSDGKVVDVDSGHHYNALTPEKAKGDEKPDAGSVSKQPQHDPDYVETSTEPRDVAYMLENHNFYNPYRNTYYGKGDDYKSFDPSKFNADDYADDNNIMSGNQNGQTEIAERNKLEQQYWHEAIKYPHKLGD